jgi:hypothetical protein
MIVWTGWGILTFLLAAAGGGSGIGEALGGAGDHANLGTAVGFAVPRWRSGLPENG